MTALLRRSVQGLVWYLKQATGEARWDEYVAHCRHHGREPMSRREFERRRAQLSEASPRARCC